MLGLRPNIRIFEYWNHPYWQQLLTRATRQWQKSGWKGVLKIRPGEEIHLSLVGSRGVKRRNRSLFWRRGVTTEKNHLRIIGSRGVEMSAVILNFSRHISVENPIVKRTYPQKPKFIRSRSEKGSVKSRHQTAQTPVFQRLIHVCGTQNQGRTP